MIRRNLYLFVEMYPKSYPSRKALISVIIDFTIQTEVNKSNLGFCNDTFTPSMSSKICANLKSDIIHSGFLIANV